ncbi:hypothetical protein WN944_006393 [Citrus x changshan-huyou]|uniref:RNA demethylase ALKBH9B n=2 Tax=Citrus TaxID=2706 RepID=A0ACB8KBD6_CITSI|nr:RNA demethylase ALKBH9B [Citrus sinensis]
MSKDVTRKPTNSGAGDGNGKVGKRLLKTLEQEELLEVLSEGFCKQCASLLETRIFNLIHDKLDHMSLSSDSTEVLSSEHSSASLQNDSESIRKRPDQRETILCLSPFSQNDGLGGVSSTADNGLSEEQKELIRFLKFGRKNDFVHIERIDGKAINVLRGLELHTKVFNTEEQKEIVESVYKLQRMGQKGQLRERTYSEPRKWMRGKGRVTMQFGCCYNYAVDKNGNPPGIIRDEEVDPLPLMFKRMIKRMVRWHILPPTCIPNSCIVNIYDEGDCIPPHIDHHDFLRPFCTVSFLAECDILFGSNLKIVGPGEFSGPVSIPLPVGSVLILNGNGADVAKHCVPAVPTKRISITFRKMDDSKLPYKFSPDPELMGIKPVVNSPSNKSPIEQNSLQKPLASYSPTAKSAFQQKNQNRNNKVPSDDTETPSQLKYNSFIIENDDFPPLGSSNSGNRARFTRAGLRQL